MPEYTIRIGPQIKSPSLIGGRRKSTDDKYVKFDATIDPEGLKINTTLTVSYDPEHFLSGTYRAVLDRDVGTRSTFIGGYLEPSKIKIKLTLPRR